MTRRLPLPEKLTILPVASCHYRGQEFKLRICSVIPDQAREDLLALVNLPSTLALTVS
jgi:hypothetical protein